ncbi:MAG: 16S rRNA (uracil(1498)-N(3))-methyltransferase [Rhodospirillaceae bacterium]|nr:16S rRNA (uracil(1498)-N(3))-methyltransferase [Rhodospirillaceae bacterium]|tara:strand:- start:2392 stop:3171 length:780 start_codon:yes stop_codon:yes gene_type:complete
MNNPQNDALNSPTNDNRTRLRLFVEYDLEEGHAVPANPDQHHYLRKVMRRKDGEMVALFNGRHGEWLSRVAYESKSRCVLIVEQQLRKQRMPPDIWSLFAPVKAMPMNNIARMSTELGVGRICPVLTKHTVVARVNTARLRAHAVESAEQSTRLNVPTVDEPVSLARLLQGWDPARRIILCAEAGSAEPVPAAMSRVQPGGAWAVMTGPEGGFSQSELDGLTKLPFVTPVRLGPRILRADTAVAAVLVCWQNHLGDWSG